jgi:SSS family transporter
MNGLDWTVVAIYMAAMILMSVLLGRGQEDQADYYVGGRSLPWWAVGVSTMATQSSSASFISIPGFVALVQGGGLSWLQYELAVPLAMIFIMMFLLPLFRQLELISVYEYLERRFGRRTRDLLSGVFLLSRGLGTGVGVYASAIPISVALGLPIEWTILGIGIVTLIYDTIGGMKAVVYSDVLQMVILVFGIGLCIYYALSLVGGWSKALSMHDQARFVALHWQTGIGDGAKYPLWGFLVGGFFLYASYYGTDQSQVQRELATPSLADTKYSLIFNGFARLPLTVAYLALGLAVGALFAADSELLKLLPLKENGAVDADYMIPTFVLENLPHGIIALIFSAILAASMSSLDSALNSLSAATMQDFVERYGPDLQKDPKKLLMIGKLTTVAWGLLIIGFAFAFRGAESVVLLVNKVGSAFYGPILAAFVAGVTIRQISGSAMIAGIIAGVGTNLVLWQTVGNKLFWMWWNATGCIVTLLVALGLSLLWPNRLELGGKGLILWDTELWRNEGRWAPAYGSLVLYFGLMVWVLSALPTWLRA